MPGSGLTDDKVREFQELVRVECNVELSPDVAWRRAGQLVALYRILMGPIPEDPAVRTSGNLPSPPVDEQLMVE